MARIITLMSGKGGVGKTTSTVNLGYAMKDLGAEVILLEGNLSSPNLSLHLGNTYFPTTLHDVMQGEDKIHNAVYEHNTGLKVVPGDVSIDAMKLINFDELKKHVQDLHLVSDFVLIDGSPGLGSESEKLLEMSDEVLILTNPDKTSLLDAKRLINFAKKKKTSIAGLVVNKHHDSKMRKENIEEFLDHLVLHTIPEDNRFEKSLEENTPYLHIYPEKEGSEAFYDLARKLTGTGKNR